MVVCVFSYNNPTKKYPTYCSKCIDCCFSLFFGPIHAQKEQKNVNEQKKREYSKKSVHAVIGLMVLGGTKLVCIK